MATMTLLREAGLKDLAGEELLHSILEEQDSGAQLWFPEPGELSPLLPGQFQRVLSPRAISEEVGYFTQGGRSRYASVECYADIKAFHSHLEPYYGAQIAQSRGIVINRWDIEGNSLPSYIRYDEKIRVRESNHKWHSTRYVYPERSAYGCPHPDGAKCHCAKVIDVHPLAATLLRQEPTPPVYFCLEGCLKADAILSLGRAVVSAASVTLWETTEKHLKRILPILRRAPVVLLITDSDYLILKGKFEKSFADPINAQVRRLTDKAYNWLRDHGVRVAYLIPPYLSWEQAQEWGGEWIKGKNRLKVGIDDHLALGGNLRQWTADNPRGCHSWKREKTSQLTTLPRRPGVSRDKALPRDLAIANAFLKTYGNDGAFMFDDFPQFSEDQLYRGLQSLKKRHVLHYLSGMAMMDSEGNFFQSPHTYVFELFP